MGKIKILSKQLADKIAAGEVVERPASVVKELLENSLDAQSRDIRILIEDAGLKSIEVIDDGQGIEADDLARACLRHATSKISTDSDLNAINTLGFRGEALASIAAVSRLLICSRCEDAPEAMQINCVGGNIETEGKTSRTRGTTVRVDTLFFNTPARLKFLKSKTTEMAQVLRVVTELALAYPQVGFKLSHNSKQLINCQKDQSVRQRIEILLGKELAEDLIPIELNLSPLKISGFIAKAGIASANRKNQYLFVNKRAVADKTVSHAVIQGYQTFLMEKKFPAVFIFIQTPPELIDVNVHPSKREVRFQDASVLHDLLAKLIKDALSRKETMPDFLRKNEKAKTDYFKTETGQRNAAALFERPRNRPLESGFPEQVKAADIKNNADELFSSREQPAVPARGADYLQAHKTYVITEDENGLVIIDQHAAHERIIFDQLLEQFKRKKIEKQKLLLPVTVHLGAAEFALMREQEQAFSALGFEIEDFGDNTLAVYAYPALLGKVDIKAELEALAGQIAEFDLSPDIDKKIVQLLAPVACHSALRANEKLSPDKIDSLLKQLWQTSSPQTCPHGRPTVINISWAELEKRFKRK